MRARLVQDVYEVEHPLALHQPCSDLGVNRRWLVDGIPALNTTIHPFQDDHVRYAQIISNPISISAWQLIEVLSSTEFFYSL